MIKEEKLYDLDDITIIPAKQSRIRHRSDVTPYYKVGQRTYFEKETVVAEYKTL